MSIALQLLLAYLCIVNIIAFIMMYVDKRRSIKRKWRISEKALFLSAILGGSLGANLGMQLFRHKTKHWYFVVFMPALLVLDLILLAVLYVHLF